MTKLDQTTHFQLDTLAKSQSYL